MNQREAVYGAIKSVLAENEINFEDGMDVATVLTKELRGQVNEILYHGFVSGSVGLDIKYDDKQLRQYCSSLQSNWIRKDKRLNGGVKYEAKNPGSRAGSGDESVKAMKTLLKTLTPGTEDYTDVETHLNARLAEISASKVKTITINMDALPEALRNKFSK